MKKTPFSKELQRAHEERVEQEKEYAQKLVGYIDSIDRVLTFLREEKTSSAQPPSGMLRDLLKMQKERNFEELLEYLRTGSFGENLPLPF